MLVYVGGGGGLGGVGGLRAEGSSPLLLSERPSESFSSSASLSSTFPPGVAASEIRA